MQCELAHETPLHVLYITLQTLRHSERIPHKLYRAHVQKQVPYYLRTIDFDTLVGFNKQHSLEVRYHLVGHSPLSSAPSPPASDPESTPSITM